MKTNMLSEMFYSAGYEDNPFFDIHGEISDTIYHLLGENTNEFPESITSLVLASKTITDDQRVDVLHYHYKKNHALA